MVMNASAWPALFPSFWDELFVETNPHSSEHSSCQDGNAREDRRKWKSQ
ncbi:hypothetical protein NPIL_47151, partial [Nephila pilipes]